MEVQPEVRLCTVTEGLTEDAVSARLFQGKLHSPQPGLASIVHSATVSASPPKAASMPYCL